jgi:flagellar capping protein FliD
MAITALGSGSRSGQISQLAASLLAKQLQPIQALQDQRNTLNQESSVLGTLKTRLSALRSTLDDLAGPGTLSPFTAKSVTNSDADVLTASATGSAVPGALGITVQQLARRATHVSDVFTDTDGLLARLGIAKATPTAATDSTGGYIYEDLGARELDARPLVDGLTHFWSANTISDLVTGVTFTLKGTSTSEVTAKVPPDADRALAAITDFVAKYNDAIGFLRQNTAIDPKAGTRGVLTLEPRYANLTSLLRQHLAVVVGSQPAGTANNLAVLGVQAAKDGTLSITDETALRDGFTSNPSAFANLFNASDGVATTLKTFVDGYAKATGAIFQTQNSLTLRINTLGEQIQRKTDALAKRQAALEDQLARQEAVLEQLNNQLAQVNNILATAAQA